MIKTTGVWVAGLVLWASNAVAQAATAVDDLPIDLETAQGLKNAAMSHRWGWVMAIVVGLLTKGLIWAGRKFDVSTKFGAVLHQFLDLPGVSWAIPIAGSVAASIVTSFQAGQPVTFDTLAQALLIGGFAGGWGGTAKKVQLSQAAEAGAAAVAEVASKEAAIRAIKGP